MVIQGTNSSKSLKHSQVAENNMKKIFIVSMLIFSVGGYSAKNLDLGSEKVFSEVLNQSLKDRVAWLKESKVNRNLLSKMAFEERYHIKDRWRAIHTLAAAKGKLAKKSLLKASKSEDWFMRDAAMKLSSEYYPKFSKRLAKKLLNDPSLIVRTSAVKSIHKLEDVSAIDNLWEALNDKINFRKGKSLWIRKHIVSALADFEMKSENVSQKKLANFIKLLKDTDKGVQMASIKALSKLTKQDLGSKKTPLELHKKRWISWWKKQN